MTAVKQAACSEAAVRRHLTTCRPHEFWTKVWRMWWRQTSSSLPVQKTACYTCCTCWHA